MINEEQIAGVSADTGHVHVNQTANVSTSAVAAEARDTLQERIYTLDLTQGGQLVLILFIPHKQLLLKKNNREPQFYSTGV